MGNVTKQVTARQRAREASLRFYELEKRRERTQARYFEAVDALDRVYAQRDREIAAVQQRAEQAATASRLEADAAIRELLDLRVPRAEVPDRLGCTIADVRRAVDAAPGHSTTPAPVADAGASGAHPEETAADVADDVADDGFAGAADDVDLSAGVVASGGGW